MKRRLTSLLVLSRFAATLLLLGIAPGLAPAAAAEAPAPEAKETKSVSDRTVRIVRSQKAGETLAELSWSATEVELDAKLGRTGYKLSAKLTGRFNSPDSLLVFGETTVPRDESTGEFSIEIPLTGEITQAMLYSISSMGELKKENFLLQVLHWQPLQARLQSERASETSYAFPDTQMHLALGYSFLNYEELGVAPFSEKALILDLGYENDLGSLASFLSRVRWDVGGRLTLLPMSPSTPETTLKLIQIRASVGYELPHQSPRYGVSIWLGSHYQTTSVAAPLARSSFGFQDLTGPQLELRGHFRPKTNSQLTASARLGGVADGMTLLPFAESRELTFTLGYSLGLEKDAALTFKLERSALHTHLHVNGESSITMDATTFSLGLCW